MINRANHQKNAGFGLIEILIAIVILAIGLLGIAGLQIAGLKNNNSAAQRSQATALAIEFADILRSNQPQVLANKFGTAASDGAEISTASLGYSATSSCVTAAGCSTAQMAETDLVNWANKVANLPQGTATSNRAGNIYTVTITWLDDRDNNATKSFQTSFRP